MWKTRITDILNLDYPIIQGPFGGGYSSVELLLTVSNLGGMGSFGAHYMTYQEILDLNSSIQAVTNRTYAINLWVQNNGFEKPFDQEGFESLKSVFKPFFEELQIPFPDFPVANQEADYHRQIEAILEVRPPVFSFVYGIPEADIIRECQKRGIKTIGNATTVAEALALEAAGVDVITATGFEAGGHRVAFLEDPDENLMGTFALIPQVADAVEVPILAAGGVANGKGIAAAMTLGAEGVQIGSAFLACKESNAPKVHRQQLLSNSSNQTELTKAFTGRLARGTKSKITKETRKQTDLFAPYPLQGLFIQPLRKAALEQNRTDLITFWGGQSAPLLKHQSASALFHSLVEEAGQLLKVH